MTRAFEFFFFTSWHVQCDTISDCSTYNTDCTCAVCIVGVPVNSGTQCVSQGRLERDDVLLSCKAHETELSELEWAACMPRCFARQQIDLLNCVLHLLLRTMHV